MAVTGARELISLHFSMLRNAIRAVVVTVAGAYHAETLCGEGVLSLLFDLLALTTGKSR
jgi:hypothetical protein